MNEVPSVQDLIGGGNLQQTVNQLAPLAKSYSGPMQNVPVGYQAPFQPSQGVAASFFSKIGAIGSESAHLVGSAATWLGRQTLDMGKSVLNFPVSTTRLGLDAYRTHEYASTQTGLTQRLQTLTNSWKSGTITSTQYKSELDQWKKDSDVLQKNLTSLQTKLTNDGGAVIHDTIGTASAIVTVMTAGLTAPLEGIGITSAKTAADYLGSAGARAVLAPAEATIANVTVSHAAFDGLTPALQAAVKDSVYTVLFNSTKDLSAAQMSRAATVNLALKYPLGFAAINSSGTQIYTDLQAQKYGAAVGALAFNAILLFSGGPIGSAMKRGGQLLTKASVAAGLRPGSVLDELSSYIADGDRRGLANVAQQKLAADKEEEVKAMIVAMDSNLKRTGGNPGQAVGNIVDHLENYVGWGSLKNLTHEQAWDNMVGYWKNAERLDSLKKAGKIEGIARNDPRPIVPGRFGTPDKINIADISDAQGQKGWDIFKQQYPNLAAANNTNLDRQMTNIFKIEDAAQRRKAIMAIPTQLGLEGVPKAEAAQMASDGYIAIIPKTHNLPVVPFEEGSKTLATTGAEGEFFVRAGSPVPVMSHLGALLTRAGLSPEMATLRTYQLFSKSFVDNIDSGLLDKYGAKLEEARNAAKDAKVAKTAPPAGLEGYSKDEIAFMQKNNISPELLNKGNVVAGEGQPVTAQAESAAKEVEKETTPQGTADYMLKRLRNYMNKPTRGGVMLGETRVRAPITDMRQLTAKDISAALNVDRTTAKQIGESIMQAHLDLPREVSGLGNRLMDYNYKYNSLSKPYARVQGAARFTFNPFFRNLRLPFKAEFLSQAQASGKFLTIPGTNWLGRALFSGQYKELDGIITALKAGKLLPGGLGDEAADLSGTANLIKLGDKYPKNALYPVASLIRDMARRANMDSATFIHQFPQDVSDAATTILHYDHNNSFLNSPLVRTLNFAFFPARFNIKVATIMARSLAKQDPLIQFAVVKGLMNADSFFTSPQGQAWYSQNADVIGLFKYISPVATLSEVAQVLGTHGESIGAYGELGGLPFGWIPALLDAMGITHIQQPYVNPTTGVVAKDYVPVTTHGRIEASIEDLIQSLFSWPGTPLGLPSKTKMGVNIAQGLTDGGKTSKTDFKQVTPTLSPQQQQFQSVVQGLHGANPAGTAPPPQSQPSIGTNPLPTSATTPNIKPASSRSGGKKKKADFTPALLPGQSTLGQL